MTYFIQCLLVFIMIFALGISGCSSDDGGNSKSEKAASSEETDDEKASDIVITDSRTDAELQTVADEALSSAGWKSTDLTVVDTSIIAELGDEVLDQVKQSYRNSIQTAGIVNKTATCLDGTAMVSGESDGLFFNVDITFNACRNAFYVLYGTVKYAGKYTYDYDVSTGTISSNDDVIMNGGVAAINDFDNTKKYNFTYKGNQSLMYSGDTENGTYTYDFGFTINSITCRYTGTKEGIVFLHPSASSYTCQ